MGYVIAFSGKRGCGKSTTAAMLAEMLKKNHINTEIFSFATVIKNHVSDAYGIPVEWMSDRDKKEKPLWRNDFPDIPEDGMTLRRLMQLTGMKLRENDPAFTVHALPETDATVIVDDLRMPAEDEALKKIGAFRIRVQAYPEYDVQDADVTETALDAVSDWDMVCCPEYGKLRELTESIFSTVILKYRDVFLDSVKRQGCNLYDIPRELVDHDMCLAAVEAPNNPICIPALSVVPKHLRTYAVCLAAVRNRPDSLPFVPPDLINEKMCLTAVQKRGGYLCFVPPQHRTHNVCMAALYAPESSYHEPVLKFIPEHVKDEEICLLAVRHNADAFRYVPDSIRGDAETVEDFIRGVSAECAISPA